MVAGSLELTMIESTSPDGSAAAASSVLAVEFERESSG